MRFFLPLRDIMKKLWIKFTALVLLLWYCLSIIGFDIHTCRENGRSFVATFVDGMTCEEIHPEHSCEHISCCSMAHDDCCKHDCEGISAPSCCSDQYQVLALTGTNISESNQCLGDLRGFDMAVCLSDLFAYCPKQTNNNINLLRPESGAGRVCDRQAALKVWRI